MNKLLLVLEIIFYTAVPVSLVLWIRNPNGNNEPISALMAFVLGSAIELVRRRKSNKHAQDNENAQQAAIQAALRKEALLVQPYFQEAGGLWNSENGTFKLKNIGEPIKNLVFEWTGNIKGEVPPISYLGKDQEFTITVKEMTKPPEGLSFNILYDDKLGNRNKKSMHYDFQNLKMVEDDTSINI